MLYKQIGTTILCIRCDDKHFLDPASITEVGQTKFSSGCVPRVASTFIGGCLLYSASSDSCEDCVQGLGLSGDGLICLGHIEHCLEYNVDKNGAIIDPNSKVFYTPNLKDPLV
jgi:hypothetical protein